MKKLSKIIAVILVVAMLVCTLTGCGASAKAESYSAQMAYIEPGYEGDVWHGVTSTVFLLGDKTYVVSETTSVIHKSGKVVTYSTYTLEGKYSVTSEDKDAGTKTVKLENADKVIYNMNGSVSATDSADTDADTKAKLTAYGTGDNGGLGVAAAGKTIVCNIGTKKFSE